MNPEIWMLPNLITIGRTIVGVGALMALLWLGGDESWDLVIGYTLIGVWILDSVDGTIARALRMITKLGTWLDPLCDKIVVVTAYSVLLSLGRVPKWAVIFVIVTILRELFITQLRGAPKTGARELKTSKLAKTKTVCQVVAICGLVFHHTYWGGLLPTHKIGVHFLVISTVLAVVSGAQYWWKKHTESRDQPLAARAVPHMTVARP